jgi:transcriptional regulator with XRE-family HTH domain
LTLRYVADQAELDIGHLSRIERGQARISLEALARLAKVLELRDLSRHLELYTLPIIEKREPGSFPGSKGSRNNNRRDKASAA